MRGLIRRVFFENMVTSLALLLGGMQVLVGHFLLVVLAGRRGPGLALGCALAAALTSANVVALPFIRRALRRQGLASVIARGYTAVGLSTILLGAVIGAAWAGFFPLAALLGAAGLGPESLLHVFRLATLPVVASLAFMLIWGFTGGQARIERTTLRIPLRGLPEALRGLRIVQISDLHIGNAMEGAKLERLIEDVNALEPDLIALTGDLFDFDPAVVEAGAKVLGGLHAPFGVYAVLGNHDVFTGREHVARALVNHAPGLRLLRGETVRVPAPAPLYVAGLEDPGKDWTAKGELPELNALGRELPKDGPVILLAHRPEAFLQAAKLGFPLVLAGHTHGGQIALPTPGGHWNPARAVTRFYRGLYHAEEHRSILYVNRGLGVAGPKIRFNCPREIAILELV
ncbi:MAG TPA: metallophosphoesterase [Myxococcota bacterium]|nr:metallophosphoesterase [Myxococcota bacterium]